MDEFFKSEGHKIAFALNYLDGEARLKVLGVTMKHYTSSRVSKKWYKDTKALLEKENLLTGLTEMRLEKVYSEMK